MERVYIVLQPNYMTWSQRGGKHGREERATVGLGPDSRGAMAAQAAACIAKSAISKTNKQNPIPGAAHAGGRSRSLACRALCESKEAVILTAVGGRNHSV